MTKGHTVSGTVEKGPVTFAGRQGAPGGPPSALAAKPVRRALAVFIGLVIVIGLIALVVLFAVGRPTPGSFEIEIAKAALQVLVIATAGAVIGAGTFYFQQQYLAETERRRTEDDRAHKGAEQDRDARRREDEALRSVIDATLDAYQRLKKERRLLRALAPEHVTVSAYDDVAASIIDIQLAFEQLGRVAPLIDAQVALTRPPPSEDRHGQKRPPFVSLHKSFNTIESYLQLIVTEYENSHRTVESAGAAGIAVTALPRLAALLSPSSSDFRAGVSYHVDNVIGVLQASLLEPLEASRVARTGNEYQLET
jgi:hypothetical protein